MKIKMWQCKDCRQIFERFKVLHDSSVAWDGSYDDRYVCPVCGSEDFYNVDQEVAEND